MKYTPAKIINQAFFSILLLGACFGLTGTSMAQNQYYVNANSGSDSNDGSQARPWKTIQHADAALTAGSGGATVHVAPGTYSGPISTRKSGTSGGRVVFLSDTKWGAKITSTNWSVNGSYVDVNGFDMTSPSSGTNYGIQISGGTVGVRVLNNNMHDFDLGGCAQFGIVNVGSGQASSLSGQAIDSEVKNNVIRRISSYSASGPNTHSCVTAHAIYDFGVRTIIQNNIISASSGPAIERVMVNGEVGGENGVGGVISGNTIFNNGGGININESIDSTGISWDYNTISNNIIVNNGVDDSISGGSCGIDYYHVTGTHNLTSNNLIYGNKPHDLCHHNQVQCGTDATSTTPATGLPITGTDGSGNAGGCPASNSKVDPNVAATFASFQVDSPTSPASNFDPDNYQVKAGSAAIQNGTTACATFPGVSPCTPILDFMGIARLAGVPTLDIGAYEQGTSASTGAPSAPTGLTAQVQ